MAFRDLQKGTDWVQWGDMVDFVCTEVYEAWSCPALQDVWDQKVLMQKLFARFGIDDFTSSVTQWRYQAAKSEVRMSVHAALRLRLRTRVNVVKLICRFL